MIDRKPSVEGIVFGINEKLNGKGKGRKTIIWPSVRAFSVALVRCTYNRIAVNLVGTRVTEEGWRRRQRWKP